MTLQTVERQTAKPVENPGAPDERTGPPTAWEEATEAVDLTGVLAEARQEAQTAAAGFAAVFEWAERQDFPPDHAERVRREAWGTGSE
jgi:hypothetical protein